MPEGRVRTHPLHSEMSHRNDLRSYSSRALGLKFTQFRLTFFLIILQMLISKLEKNKNMKPEERANIMKTLKELGEKISQLKDELKTSSAVSTPSKVKTKTEVSSCIPPLANLQNICDVLGTLKVECDPQAAPKPAGEVTTGLVGENQATRE